VSELPPGWAKQTLGEIGLIQLGKMLDKVKNKGTPTKYLRNVNVRWGAFDLTDLEEMRVTDVERARFTIEDGDLLICEGGEPGRCAVWVDGSNHLAFQKALLRFRPLEGISSEWIANALKLKAAKGDLEQYFTGTTIKHLPAVSLGRVSVPVPPVGEQRRIVAKLDTLFSCSNRARTELGCVPELLSRAKGALLNRAFRGDLTADWRRKYRNGCEPINPRSEEQLKRKYAVEVDDFEPPYALPPNWIWLRLPQLGDLDRGRSKHRPRNDPKLFGGSYPFIQTGDVKAADPFITSAAAHYNESGLSQSKLWPKGTLCITIAANIAETAILAIEACFPDSVVGFLPDKERTSAAYVEFFLRTARAELERFAPAIAQKNINLDTLAGVRVPLAPLPEQYEIVRRIEAAFSIFNQLAAEARSAAALLDRLDRAILAKAFRGELVPQNPIDEPASALLERIRVSRAVAPDG
jgi:type I restriction enzyme S subunit